MTELDTNPELMFVVKLRKKTHDPDGLLWYAFMEDWSGQGRCSVQARTVKEALEQLARIYHD